MERWPTWPRSSKKRRIVSYQGTLNLSAIINAGVAAVRGPYTHYLFLNNDTEAIDPGWLEHMLGYGQRADVGVVGALLVSEDELVRHGGVILGMNGSADHAHKNCPFRGWLSGRNPGHNGGLLASRDVSAVTGACMLTRADLFHRLNGFDERLAVGFNDVDYCLRTAALGYKVIQDAYTVLYHLESERGPLGAVNLCLEDSVRFRKLYRELILKGDPFYSPILSKFTTEIRCDPLATSGQKRESERLVLFSLHRRMVPEPHASMSKYQKISSIGRMWRGVLAWLGGKRLHRAKSRLVFSSGR